MSTFFPLVFELPRWYSVKESACQAGNEGSSLGREDPLEEEMAIHSSFFVWEIPWTEKSGGLAKNGVAKNLTGIIDLAQAK